MDQILQSWLAAVASTAFRWSAVAFLVLNGVAAVGVLVMRSRPLVNRWTGPVLAANLLLAGTGIALPLAATATRMAVGVVASALGSAAPATRDQAPAAMELSGAERERVLIAR